MSILRYLSLTALAAAASALTACGGGGGGSGESGPSLAVSFDYGTPDPTYAMWMPMQQAPTLQGLNGKTPDCVLDAGVLPAGVTVNRSSCVLEGVPDALGQYDYTVRLTVAGYSGSVSASGRIEIVKPGLLYTDSGSMEWRKPWRAEPLWADGLTPSADYAVGDFRVVDSSLPAGLSIDSQTGVISGTFIGFSSPRFNVRATIRHAGRTLDIDSQILEPITLAPSVVYRWQADRALHVGDVIDIPPPVFDDGSAITSVYQASFSVETGASAPCLDPQPLPAGLVLNTRTGAITGTADAAFAACLVIRYLVEAPDGGGGVQGWQQIPLQVQP